MVFCYDYLSGLMQNLSFLFVAFIMTLNYKLLNSSLYDFLSLRNSSL